MSVNDDLPFIRQQLDLIRDADALCKPILGICLGAQLIAKALGARTRMPQKRSAGIRSTGPARPRVILCTTASRPRKTCSTWHKLSIGPTGAELVADSYAPPSGVPSGREHLRVTIPSGGNAGMAAN